VDDKMHHCVDNIGRVYDEYTNIPKLVPSIYYIALSDNNIIVSHHLLNVDKVLQSNTVKLIDLCSLLQEHIDTSLTNDVKEELQNIVKTTVWPHVKAIVDSKTENTVIMMVSKKSNRSVKDIAERKLAVLRYIKQKLNNHKGNSKRDIAKKCIGELIRSFWLMLLALVFEYRSND
jgi:hypothetical protein